MKHTPHDTDYPFTNANIEFHSATGVQSKISGKPNPNGCWYEAPALPKGISENDNRLTVALDVSFWNGYLDKGHFVLGVRHKKANYEAPGDNRCGAIIVGNWGSGHQRAAAIEEPEINKIADNTFKNKLHHEVSNVIQENRRYRLIIDSIVNNGYVAYEARIKDHSTGQIVYQSPGIIFSSFTHNYDLSARGIIVATIPGNQHDPNPGAGSYSNLTSYWTEDVIATPIRNFAQATAARPLLDSFSRYIARRITMQRSFLIAAAFAGLVSACGGGSEDNPPNGGNGNPPPPVFRSNVVCDLYIPELSNEQPLHIRRVANQVQPLDWSHRSGRYSGFAAFGRPDSVVQRPEDRSISLAPWDASLPHLQEMRIQIEAPLMHKSAACMLHLKHIKKDESLATLHPLRIELLTPDSAQKPLDQLYVLEGFSLLWSHFPLTRIHVSFLIDPGKYAIPNIGEKDIQICQSYARLFGPQSAACEPARLSAAGGGDPG